MLVVVVVVLRHEQLPRLRGHRPRQALGNPPLRLPLLVFPVFPAPRIRLDWVQMGEISDLFLVFFFFGCGGPEDGVQGAEEEEHRVLRRQERRQVAAVQGPQ